MVLINSLFWFVHLETTANNMKCFTSFTIPLCLLFFAISSGQDTDCDETLEEFEEEFGQYAVDPDLVEEWKENLEEAEEEINEQNQKYQDGESTFWDALNEFSELSDEDFLKEKTGLIPQEGDDRITYATGLLEMPKRLSRKISMKNKAFFDQFASSRSNPPASIDSVANGKVTTVKNQGNCGSCAAFTSASVAETCMLMQDAKFDQLDLSEQALVDCAFNGDGANGCNGAWLSAYPDFIVESSQGALAHQNGYPYTASRGSCKKVPNYNAGAKASQALYTGACSEDKMMGLLAKYGSVGTTVSSKGPLTNYGGGIFDGCLPGAQIDHAVVVVGYGTDSNGVDFWKVKNSWGPHWGENGYIRIKRGVGMCSIGKECSIMDCNPPPANAGALCDTNQWNSSFGGKPLNGNPTLNFNGGAKYLKCTDGMCAPNPLMVEFTGHACQYICGRNNCGGKGTRSL